MEAQTEARSFHWGLVSKYRTEIMGFACIWIMLSHNFCIWPESTGWYWVKRIFQFGNLGVELFLIVSGIGLYFAWQNRKSLGQFYQRRYVRLLIPYFLIAVPYWIWLDLHVGGLDWSCFLLDFTQLSLPFRGVITTWYIPASAVFYLLFPLIYYVLCAERYMGTPRGGAHKEDIQRDAYRAADAGGICAFNCSPAVGTSGI